MTKAEIKAELSKIAKSYFTSPCIKQAMLAGVREEVAQIENIYGKCLYDVKCQLTTSGLPVIQIIPRPQTKATSNRQKR